VTQSDPEAQELFLLRAPDDHEDDHGAKANLGAPTWETRQVYA
jgi:hypothetical protein